MSGPREASVDTDRVALSHELALLGERFAVEATLWRQPEAVAALERTARHLADLSRGVLHSDRLDHITAYADAADLLIRHIEGTRRFFRTVLTPPTVRRPQ